MPVRTGSRSRSPTGPQPSVDQVLVAVGRKPNGGVIDAGAAGVTVESNGSIEVDRQMRTNVPWIYAIGDVVPGPMLAHKATHEGHTAAEVIAGVPGAAFDARTIPSVAYTDPEVAWMGLTETAARDQRVEFEKAVFPWAASGRALGLGRSDGFTKLLLEPGTRRVLGAGIVGVNAGELIAETVLAYELGANAEDIAKTIHPHPTLSETVGFAARAGRGHDHRPDPEAGARSIRSKSLTSASGSFSIHRWVGRMTSMCASLQGRVLAPVALECGAALVELEAVDLGHHALPGPPAVDEVALDQHVAKWFREVRLPDESEEPFLQLRLGPWDAAVHGGQRFVEGLDAAATMAARHQILKCAAVDALEPLSRLEHPA